MGISLRHFDFLGANGARALPWQNTVDDLINTLDFRNKSEIAVSGVLKQYWQWVSESETESKPKKSGETSAGPVLLLICFQMDTQYKNLKYPI